MSVYNRKMFKPRNARNALSMSAGIMPVQKFHSGGTVAPHSHPHPAGSVFNLASGQVSQPPTMQSIMSRSGQRFIAPRTSTNPALAADIGLATKSLKGGLGSLSIPEQMGINAAMGKLSGRNVAAPIKDYLGDSVIGEVAETLAETGGIASGGASGILTGLFSDDSGSQGTLAGRIGLMQPSDEYLASLGIKPADPNPANLQTASARGRPFPPKSPVQAPGMFQGPRQAVTPLDMSDPQVRAKLEQERRAREITEAGGQAAVDPNTGEITSGPTDDIAKLIQQAQTDQRAAVADELQTEPFNNQQQVDELDTESFDNQQSTSTADPTDPGPKDPEDPADRDEANNQTAAIVAQAKAANAKSGVPSLTTAKQEVDVASQKGTGSPEDIKADFLKLLPKYEDDPKVNGLNIALMGFAIAKDGLVEGMKKTLPNFIKSAEKRQAFKRETDLLASKYAINRKEADRTRGLTEKDYFVETAFTSPDGRKFVPGQPVTLSRDAFKLMESQGLTGNLTTSSIYLEQAKAKTKAAQGRGYKEINALYKNETREFGGVKYDILVPTPYGLKNGATSTVLASENDLPVLTNAYVSNLDKINALDLGVQEARALVATGDATGGKAVIGNLFDGLRGAGMNGVLKTIGFSPPEKLSTAGQYAKVHGVLAMQLAPILLGESGKTISNVDRVRVATALGYEASIDNNGNAIINLAGGPGTLFQSKEQADAALVEVQNILRNRAKEEHAKYRGVMTSVGQVFEERKVDENTQSALTRGLGRDLVDTGKTNDQGMPIYKLPPIGE